jgi:hypothetical protein
LEEDEGALPATAAEAVMFAVAVFVAVFVVVVVVVVAAAVRCL